MGFLPVSRFFKDMDREKLQNCWKSWEKHFRRENLFQVRDKDKKSAYGRVYCEKPGHKSSECELVSESPERRLILSKKKLCFDCTVSKHRASDCRSNKACANCKRKHQTSTCKKTSNFLLTTNDNHVTYPLVIIDIKGLNCRALIDTGAWASYASSTPTDWINKKPIRKQYKRIEIIMSYSINQINPSVFCRNPR